MVFFDDWWTLIWAEPTDGPSSRCIHGFVHVYAIIHRETNPLNDLIGFPMNNVGLVIITIPKHAAK